MPVEWTADTVTVQGTTVRYGPLASAPKTGGGHLLALKPRWTLERYLDLVDRLKPRNIIELGVYGGGSTVLLAAAAQPRRLAAVDIRPQPPPALVRWIEEHGQASSVSLHYGVDQADAVRLRSIADEIGPLDLVVDDASHLPGPTRASFDALFPRLRPGGVYVIEDWMTAHAMEVRMGPPRGRDPELLSPMVCELVVAIAYQDARNAIAEVDVARDLVVVTRGPAELNDEFALEQCYFGLGASVLQGHYATRSSRTLDSEQEHS